MCFTNHNFLAKALYKNKKRINSKTDARGQKKAKQKQKAKQNKTIATIITAKKPTKNKKQKKLRNRVPENYLFKESIGNLFFCLL